MKLVENKGTCFIISPIGPDGSEIRRRSDQVFKHIIEPVARESGFKTVRADQIPNPGIITSQIIRHLAEDPLVIANLTGHNPNVFYELAVRHVARKPVIQITQVGEPIPFDVAPTRTIQLDHKDLESAALCRQALSKQIRAIQSETSDIDNPISSAIDLQLFRQAAEPSKTGDPRMISMLSDLRAMTAQILANSDTSRNMRHMDPEEIAEAQAEAEADAGREAQAEEEELQGQYESEAEAERQAEAEAQAEADEQIEGET